jgi:dihydroorotase
MTNKLLFINAHLICPEQGLDGNGWLATEGDKITAIGKGDNFSGADKNAKLIDCKGDILAPGLVDMRVKSGDPGAEHLETLSSLKEAAAHGGITSFAILPSTEPVIDTAAMIDSLHLRASRIDGPSLYCYGAITKELEDDQMAELGMMAGAGARAFASGSLSVQNAQTMRRIMTYASMLDLPVIHHCEDKSLTEDGDMNEGETSTRLGMLGQPAAAETIILQRDIELAKLTGVHYHAAHISTAGAVAAIRKAKTEGVRITADTAPPYFMLNELAVSSYDAACKLNPPLRTEADRLALLEGLQDGTIDAIASDHVPVNPDMKMQPFTQASTGASGIELLLCMTLRLVRTGTLSLSRAFALISRNPAQILKLEAGTLKPGMPADLVRINPNMSWIIEGRAFKSLSRITPFEGQPAEGKVTGLWIGGAPVARDK